MTIPVPPQYGRPPYGEILTSLPVNYSDLARNANWLAGAPRALVPAFGDLSMDLGFQKGTGAIGGIANGYIWYPIRFRPTPYGHVRMWRAGLRGADGEQVPGGPVAVSVDGESALKTPPGLSTAAVGTPTLEMELLDSLSTRATAWTETTISLGFGKADTDELPTTVEAYLHELSCWEVPITALSETGSYAGQTTSIPGQPIVASQLARLSTLANPTNVVPVKHLLTWAAPYAYHSTAVLGSATIVSSSTEIPTQTSSATFTAIPQLDTIEVLPRNVVGAPGDSQECFCDVFAWVSGGGSGEVRVVSGSNGAGSATAITNTTPAWTTGLAYDTNSEDLDTGDGGSDTVTLQYRATAGTLYVAGAVFYDTI